MKYVLFMDTIAPLAGRQLILLDLMSSLSENNDNEYYYLNNDTSNETQYIENSNLICANLDSLDVSEFENAVFITPLNYLMHLIAKIGTLKEARIFLYNYDERSFGWLLANIGNKSINSELKELIKTKKAYGYFDRKCVLDDPQSNCIPFLIKESDFLPYRAIKLISANRISIGLFGDVTQNWLIPINNFLNNLQISDFDLPVDVHVVGKTNIPIRPFPPKNFNENVRFIYTGNIKNYAEYFSNNVDLLIASDINAINASTASVPVILPIVEDKPFIGNNFICFYEGEKDIYNWSLITLAESNVPRYTLKYIIDRIYKNNKKEKLAENCYNFAISNYYIKNVAANFAELLNNSNLTLTDCLQITAIRERYEDFKSANDILNFSRYLEREKEVKSVKNSVANKTVINPAPKIEQTSVSDKTNGKKLSVLFRKKQK